ncbi:MAG: hypothetical protein ACRBN8_15800 [Nannocystales bacterium]
MKLYKTHTTTTSRLAAILSICLVATACDDDVSSSGSDSDTDSGTTGGDSDSDPTTTPTTDPTTTPTTTTTTTGDTDPTSGETDTPSTGTDTGTDTVAETDTVGDSSSSGGGAMCGDDAIEDKEVCDGSALADETCESQGFVGGGDLACADDCTEFDTSGCIAQLCANDTVEGDEVCDGTDLADTTCADLDFDGGTLGCAKDCTAFDTSMCTTAFSMCNTPGSAIGAGDVALTTDTITLPAGAFVADVNISVDAAHAAVGDLDITISHNDTTTSARLQSGICGADADINGEYDAGAAAVPACGGPPAVDGAVLPEGSLDAFTGIPDPAGVWQLDITDNDTLANEGTLNEWCVNYLVTEGNPEACGNDIVTFTETCDGTNAPSTCAVENDDLAGYGVLGCAADCAAFDAADCCTADVGDGGAYVANFSDGADPAACADTDIIDISMTGLATAASGNCGFDPTPITLPAAFNIHGVDQLDWFVNPCGYISAENTGSDFSNDCPMNGNRPGTIAAYHDDLDTDQGGVVYYEHFDAGMCPRESDTAGAVECDVFFWNGINQWNTANVFDLNLVLYPTTGEAVSVFGPNAPGLGSATMGISSIDGNTAFTAGCNDGAFTTTTDGTACMIPATSACPAP